MLKPMMAAVLMVALTACGQKAAAPPPEPQAAPLLPPALEAGGDFQTTLQTALIEAQAGETIVLPEGVFKLTSGLSLDVPGVTLRGAGQEKTILDFSGQTTAGEGLLVTSDDVTLMDFGVRDSKGDGIKSKGADRIIYRYLTVDWSGEPKSTNGAYGIYPVESKEVLIENVTVRGASDAGIYVGQSDNIVVRNSVAEFNVAGIEIENSTRADVYGNVVRDNAGGVLVFDLPDLPMIGGHSTRIFDNTIERNNTPNFAAPGNIVAGVPSGTGVIVLGYRNVQIVGNRFADNRSTHILLTAYSQPFTDARYNPLPRDVWIRNNRYEGGGTSPQGILTPFADATGGILPSIVSDGVTRYGAAPDQALNLVIDEPGTVNFISFGLGAYPADPARLKPTRAPPLGTAPTPLPAVVLAHAGP